MYEALGAVLEYGRLNLPIGGFEAFVDAENARSIALMERLGFSLEGTGVDVNSTRGLRDVSNLNALVYFMPVE